eukprot:scaffold38186_cov22-Phaeocystis_antarctica.AAC.1
MGPSGCCPCALTSRVALTMRRQCAMAARPSCSPSRPCAESLHEEWAPGLRFYLIYPGLPRTPTKGGGNDEATIADKVDARREGRRRSHVLAV